VSDGPELAYDPVTLPEHYVKGGMEAIDVITAFLGVEGAYWFCRGNGIKYHLRADDKGATVQDLEKSIWYSKKAAELKKQLDYQKHPF
jgi:hypothetical protein